MQEGARLVLCLCPGLNQQPRGAQCSCPAQLLSRVAVPGVNGGCCSENQDWDLKHLSKERGTAGLSVPVIGEHRWAGAAPGEACDRRCAFKDRTSRGSAVCHVKSLCAAAIGSNGTNKSDFSVPGVV